MKRRLDEKGVEPAAKRGKPEAKAAEIETDVQMADRKEIKAERRGAVLSLETGVYGGGAPVVQMTDSKETKLSLETGGFGGGAPVLVTVETGHAGVVWTREVDGDK